MRHVPFICPLAIALVAGCTSLLAAAEDTDLPPSHSVEPQLYATGFEFSEGPAIDGDGNVHAPQKPRWSEYNYLEVEKVALRLLRSPAN